MVSHISFLTNNPNLSLFLHEQKRFQSVTFYCDGRVSKVLVIFPFAFFGPVFMFSFTFFLSKPVNLSIVPSLCFCDKIDGFICILKVSLCPFKINETTLHLGLLLLNTAPPILASTFLITFYTNAWFQNAGKKKRWKLLKFWYGGAHLTKYIQQLSCDTSKKEEPRTQHGWGGCEVVSCLKGPIISVFSVISEHLDSMLLGFSCPAFL